MSYFMIEIDSFDNAAVEQPVSLNWSGHGRIKCIRTTCAENNDGFADIRVSYRVDAEDSWKFFSQTAKNLKLNGMRFFRLFINTGDVFRKLEEYLSMETC